MDGLKLEKWKHSFQQEVKKLQIEYDSFQMPEKFEEIYQLQIDETTQTLCLWVADNVSQELKNRLSDILLKTEPEDSI